jgi:hypothetical protein
MSTIRKNIPGLGSTKRRGSSQLMLAWTFLKLWAWRRDQKLSDEEWAAQGADRLLPRHEATSMAELRVWKNDGVVLAAKKQFEKKPLGNRPVSVLRADSKMEWQRMYDAGVKKGNGNEEERERYRKLIASLDERDIPVHKEILKLSSVGKFRTVDRSGQCIHMVDPEAVAGEVKLLGRRYESTMGGTDLENLVEMSRRAFQANIAESPDYTVPLEYIATVASLP